MIEGDVAMRPEPVAASSATKLRRDAAEGELSPLRLDEFKRRIEALEREIEAIRHKLLAIGEVGISLVS
jgi:hypothetical protein